MEKRALTENARTKLRAFWHSPEGYEVQKFMERLAPLAIIDHESGKPLEIAALTGAKNKGWKECMRMIEDISDPDFGTNKNLK